MNIFTIIGGVLIISANLYFIAFSDSNCAIALNMVSAGLWAFLIFVSVWDGFR
jgi:hypothetical protein